MVCLMLAVARRSWSEVEVLGALKPKRMMSHTSGLFNNGSVLLTFGGCTSSCCFGKPDPSMTCGHIVGA
eukprot:5042-Eustigmatos_ZCMA.PRE.1